jgi:phosphatidate cytidylyltransferase
MKQRIIVGLIAAPVILIPIWLGGVWGALLVSVAAGGGGWEFYHLMEIDGFKPNRILGVAWAVALVLTGFGWPFLPLSLVLFVGLIATLVDALHRQPKPINSWMVTAVGAIYLGAMLGQMLALRQLPNGLWWVLIAVLITWANDTSAYFVGVTLGRHKLWPRISPKKTWEGTIGGWVGAALAGAGLVALTPVGATVSPLFGALLGGLGGVLALLGDLSISILKRQVGVKDSGWLFPGHGGILDRMDSLLFVVPFVYQMVLLWTRLMA